MRLIVEYVRRHLGDEAVERMLELAGETRSVKVLEDEAVWSSYDEKIRLFEAAAVLTGDDDIARKVGETVLESTVGGTVVVALGLLGSTASLLRMLPRACSKFSTAGEMHAESVSRTSARVRYRVKPGYELSHFDCDYSLGLLTQTPALFGLPPAEITHDVCQVRDGATECVYDIRWRARRRVPWRRERGLPAELLLARLHQLQDTLGDLADSTDVDDVLDAIAARAGSAVSADRFVLAAQLEPGEDARVRYAGFTQAAAQAVADSLVAGEPVVTDDGHVAVVEVRAARRSFGHLAAFARYPFLDHERELLEAYARLAATALSAATALASAEDRRRAAEALLGLARNLHRAHTRREVAEAVATASQTVVEADATGVLLFGSESDDTLRVVGHSGFPDELLPLVSSIEVRPQDTPELGEILARPDRPRIYDQSTPDPFIGGLLPVLGLSRIAVAPVYGERTHGVLITGWSDERRAPVPGKSLFNKLAGLADQATSALEKAELVDKVHAQATTDSLTGLANRRRLTEWLNTAISNPSPHVQPALLFIDLDRFKVVNDTLGHAAGDELLKAVAQRLEGCVRTDDHVARLGGDEFTVFLPSVTDATAALAVGEQVVAALAEPVVLDGRTLHVRCSVGVLLLSADTASVSEALRDADAAMYAAKKAGGNRCVLYDPDRFASDDDVLELESDLYNAVTESQLHIAYQPQVELTTGAVVGAECLIRWNHPTRGLVPPDSFLPIAEATGLIVPLDLWVMRMACAQGAAWWRDGLELRIAVNVSARTLTDPRFVPAVIESLSNSGLPAAALEIEMTEATAISDTDAVRAVLDALRGHDVSVAVDDLGTGYSSLSWISTFPVNRIKIDRSFVADLATGGRGEPLVEAIVAMAHRLGHDVIAEGVETSEQVQRLLLLGCTEAQGFHLGRPGPAEAVGYLARHGVAQERV
ncbi:MAG: EAL domain-containing protein [Frankiaceae bacterium]|nr:EAL domain-containing protein [Frankiaceae bacterium]